MTLSHAHASSRQTPLFGATVLDEGMTRRLVAAAQTGSHEALDTLIEHNMRWVLSRVRAYRRRHDCGSLEEDDLVQEGYFGLRQAILKFDLTTSYRLSTYTTAWIDQAIGHAVATGSRTVRLPVHAFDRVNRINRARSVLTSDGQEVSSEAVAAHLGMDVADVTKLWEAAQRTNVLSLDWVETPGEQDDGRLDAVISDHDADEA